MTMRIKIKPSARIAARTRAPVEPPPTLSTRLVSLRQYAWTINSVVDEVDRAMKLINSITGGDGLLLIAHLKGEQDVLIQLLRKAVAYMKEDINEDNLDTESSRELSMLIRSIEAVFHTTPESALLIGVHNR